MLTIELLGIFLFFFCDKLNVSFPAKNTGVLTTFLCSLANVSQAPRAHLKIACAALRHVYKRYGDYTVINDEHIQLLVTALIKSATNKPMNKSNVYHLGHSGGQRMPN